MGILKLFLSLLYFIALLLSFKGCTRAEVCLMVINKFSYRMCAKIKTVCKGFIIEILE